MISLSSVLRLLRSIPGREAAWLVAAEEPYDVLLFQIVAPIDDFARRGENFAAMGIPCVVKVKETRRSRVRHTPRETVHLPQIFRDYVDEAPIFDLLLLYR